MENDDATGPGAARPSPPLSLVLSCLLGAVGLVWFALGALVGNDTLFVVGAGFGALSLGAALYWRSELISSWRSGAADQRPPAGPAR